MSAVKKAVWVTSVLGAVSFIIVLLVTSFQLVLYADLRFYEKEYAKYNVLEAVNMEMKDVLYVTDEMMDYLIDKREDLVVVTTVGGEEREFFNDREKAHMADVKNLFMGGLMIRRIALALTVISIAIAVISKQNFKLIIPRAFEIGTAIFGVLVLIFGILAYNNFSELFVQFHLLFFDNDLWILNPATDLMINILPEGFFFDTVKAIVLVFITLLVLMLGISIFADMKFRKNNN